MAFTYLVQTFPPFSSCHTSHTELHCMTLAVRSGSISSPSDSESSDEEPLYPHEDEEEHVAASFRPDEIPPESDCAASSDTNPGTDLTDDSTPRRLRRARAVLLHALECVWTVIVAKAGAEGPNERRRHSNAASDLIDRPWTSLSATLGSLQPSLEDELVLAAPYISQSTSEPRPSVDLTSLLTIQESSNTSARTTSCPSRSRDHTLEHLSSPKLELCALSRSSLNGSPLAPLAQLYQDGSRFVISVITVIRADNNRKTRSSYSSVPHPTSSPVSPDSLSPHRHHAHS